MNLVTVGRRVLRPDVRRSRRPVLLAGLRFVPGGDLAGVRRGRDARAAGRRDRPPGAGPGAVAAAGTDHRALPAADAAADDGLRGPAARAAGPAAAVRRRRGAARRSGGPLGRRTLDGERLRADRVHGHRGPRPRAAGRAGHDRPAGAAATRRGCWTSRCEEVADGQPGELCLAGSGWRAATTGART